MTIQNSDPKTPAVSAPYMNKPASLINKGHADKSTHGRHFIQPIQPLEVQAYLAPTSSRSTRSTRWICLCCDIVHNHGRRCGRLHQQDCAKFDGVHVSPNTCVTPPLYPPSTPTTVLVQCYWPRFRVAKCAGRRLSGILHFVVTRKKLRGFRVSRDSWQRKHRLLGGQCTTPMSAIYPVAKIGEMSKAQLAKSPKYGRGKKCLVRNQEEKHTDLAREQTGSRDLSNL